MGPTNWHLSTNDWAGYATAQWQPSKLAVFSAGLRWEREQLPPPIAALGQPRFDRSQTKASPAIFGQQLGSARQPRHRRRAEPLASAAPGLRHVLRPHGKRHHRDRAHADRLAQGRSELLHAPIRRLPTLLGTARRRSPTCLPDSQQASSSRERSSFAPNFRNPEVHQAVAAVEQPLPGRVELTASAMLSLGRRLPISIDTNFNSSVNPSTITYASERPDRHWAHQGRADHCSVLRFVAIHGCPAGAPLNAAASAAAVTPIISRSLKS